MNIDSSRAAIDRLWSPHVAAWYKGGKEDPALALLRLDAEKAEVWLGGSSFLDAIRMLIGDDPKQVLKENVAVVNIRSV